MSIAIKSNADDKVLELVYKQVVQSCYRGIQDDVANCYPIQFVDNMQKLVVKVACIVSEVAVTVKFTSGDYHPAINYLCKGVLCDEGLYGDWKSLKINRNANKNKHSIEDVDVDDTTIARGVNLYNRLINQLASNLSLPSLRKLRITAQIGGAAKEKDKQSFSQSKSSVNTNNNQERKSAAAAMQRAIDKSKELAKAKNASNAPHQKPTPQKPPQTDKSRFELNDAVGSLTVELLPGNGWFTKNMVFWEKKVLHCVLNVFYRSANKLKRLTALIDGHEIVLKEGKNELELPGNDYNFTPLKITVTATVQLGFLKTKPLKCAVSRNF